MTDGLRVEREQGITIDVAHRFFTTPQRSFILADTGAYVIDGDNLRHGLTGVDDPYETLRDPDLVPDGTRPITAALAALEALLGERGLL